MNNDLNSNTKRFFKNVNPEDWNSWIWQMQNRVETVEQLKRHIDLTNEEEMGIRKCLDS